VQRVWFLVLTRRARSTTLYSNIFSIAEFDPQATEELIEVAPTEPSIRGPGQMPKGGTSRLLSASLAKDSRSPFKGKVRVHASTQTLVEEVSPQPHGRGGVSHRPPIPRAVRAPA
jgi:hypothetical protein